MIVLFIRYFFGYKWIPADKPVVPLKYPSPLSATPRLPA